MGDAALPRPNHPGGWASWRNRLVRSRRFQSWAARFPLTRPVVRREGEQMFALVSGFVQSQALSALVRLGCLDHMSEGWTDIDDAARAAGLAEDRARVLFRAGVAMGVLEMRGASFRTSRRGAALLGVPGLAGMIAHHDVLYRDMADPVAFFRGDTETELAAFWPYVFGGGAEAGVAARYSRLMSESQGMVADETLAQVDLRGVRRLADLGGGTGAFLARAAELTPAELILFDLPGVLSAAAEPLAAAGLSDRVRCVPGSFLSDPLPGDCDAMTLVRVLYDHTDATVATLLKRVHAALLPGGRLVVSEPMTGADRPHVAGDVYFANYCMAMGTGRARAAGEIAALLRQAGFARVRPHRPRRPFVTSVIEAWR